MLSNSLDIWHPAIFGGVSFSPSDLFAGSETGDWFDIHDLSSMTIARNGTGPAPGDGDVVGRIVGQVNSMTLTAPNDASRPILRSDAAGYHLKFDNVDDKMNGVAGQWISPADDDPGTLALVVSQDLAALGQTGDVWGFGVHGGFTLRGLAAFSNSTIDPLMPSTHILSRSFTDQPTAFMEISGGGTDISFYENETDKSGTPLLPATPASHPLRLSSRNGAGSTGANFHFGLASDRALTDDERIALAGYMIKRYKITL